MKPSILTLAKKPLPVKTISWKKILKEIEVVHYTERLLVWIQRTSCFSHREKGSRLFKLTAWAWGAFWDSSNPLRVSSTRHVPRIRHGQGVPVDGKPTADRIHFLPSAAIHGNSDRTSVRSDRVAGEVLEAMYRNGSLCSSSMFQDRNGRHRSYPHPDPSKRGIRNSPDGPARSSGTSPDRRNRASAAGYISSSAPHRAPRGRAWVSVSMT